MTDTLPAELATCPVRLLVPGDRIRLGETVLDVTAAYALPGRVELSFMAVTESSWAYSTDVLPPDLEVPIIHTATEGLSR